MKSTTNSPIPDQAAGEPIDIVFDQVAVDGAPPEYSFIEVENSQRASIKFGEWIHRDDGYWVLRISTAPTTGSAPEPVEMPETLWDAAYKALTSRYKDENNADSDYWGAFNSGIDDAIDAMRGILEDAAPAAPVAVPVAASNIEQYVLSVLPSVYYMDPPDGGDVSILEQLRRMADDAAKYRALTAAPAPHSGEAANIETDAVMLSRQGMRHD